MNKLLEYQIDSDYFRIVIKEKPPWRNHADINTIDREEFEILKVSLH
jgi:hypothetical protein